MTDWKFVARVIVKAAVLFIVVNLAFAALNGTAALGHVSIYNILVPGRERLPYGDQPQAYNLSINDINAMLRSHVVARPKAENEFRVFLIGDSSVWGVLLQPDETVTAYLNTLDLTAADGREMVFYNLGYPTMSLLKDVMILDAAIEYQPDMVIWLTTLQSFWRGDQFQNPIVQNNLTRAAQWVEMSAQSEPDFLSQTLVGQRREVADWFRLQLYGISWALTGVDQVYPEYDPLTRDFEEDVSWKTFTEPTPLTDALHFDLIKMAASRLDVPLLLVNEPMFISSGENSDLRYNFFYPRWAYDGYRELYIAFAQSTDIPYLDLWDAIDPRAFTDTPVHLNPQGSRQLAQKIAEKIIPPN